MKIAILSDIHGNAKALKAVIDDMNRQEVDEIFILGDVVIKGPESQKTYDLIVGLNPTVWIKGNTEEFFNLIDDDFVPEGEMEKRIYSEFQYTLDTLSEDAINHLKDLPEDDRFEVDGVRILCVHGSDLILHEQVGIMMPEHELKAMLRRMDADIMLCGHTHWPYSATFDGRSVINVGSVGLPKDRFGATYVILEFENGTFSHSIRRVVYE